MEMRSVFDLNRLSEQELGCVEFVLNSPAYIDVFKPYLEKMRDDLTLRLLDRTEARRTEYPDDFLAGSIVTIKGLLEFFEHIIRETKMQRIDDSQRHVNPVGVYDLAQSEGRHDPVLGANEPLDNELERMPPEEDY
jgi:hypothetical protein